MDMHSRVRECMTTYHAAQIPDKGRLSNGALFDTMNLSKLQNPGIDQQFSEDYPRKYTFVESPGEFLQSCKDQRLV
jgi:hypothetical protein